MRLGIDLLTGSLLTQYLKRHELVNMQYGCPATHGVRFVRYVRSVLAVLASYVSVSYTHLTLPTILLV